MSVESKVPEIRFKGFSGEWENRKLDDNAEFSKGQGYSKNDLVDTGLPVILYGRLYTKYQTIISDIDTFVLKNNKSILSKGNEIIVPASGETAEDIARASAVINSGVLLGGDLNIIYPSNKLDSIFLALTISNGKPQKDLSKRAQGKSVVHVRNADLKEINIYYPSQKKEQTKIGNYFQQLDTLIAQHQDKHDKLLQIKKSLLEKMFPKQGETKPEIRFKGFSEPWEERALGNLGSIAMNKRIFKDQTSDKGDIPFFKIGTFGSKPDAFISKGLFDKYKSKYPFPEVGDLLISASGSIGRIVEYTGDDQYFQDSNIVWLKHDEKVENTFLKVFYSIVKWSGLEGSTIKRLYNKNILETQISIPTPEEQTKIGSFFKNLDTLLSQHQSQLNKLKQIKQACLAKMFV